MAKNFGTGWGKPSGRLADYMNVSKGSMLLGDIQAHMIKEHSKPSTRRQDIIHPSEVSKTGWCPRATYRRIKRCRELEDPFWKPSEAVGVQLLNIFDEGHYIHDKWQKRLRDMNELWGDWICEVCALSVKGELYPQRCSSCNSTLITYKEIPLRSPGDLIYGHADGGVPSKKAIIEIKSVGTGTARIEAPEIFKANSEGSKIDLQGLWRDIKEPFPAHVRQGQLYLYICKEMGLDFNKVIFLYESKFNQGAKEFVVDYNYDIVEPLLQQVWQIVDVLGGGMPNAEDCGICSKEGMSYPFICQCTDDPIKCPYGGCKECKVYGSEIITVGVGNSTTPEEPKSPIRRSRIQASSSSGDRITRIAKRTV